MARHEQVMISTDASYEDVVSTIADALESPTVTTNTNGYAVVRFPAARTAVVIEPAAGEYEDDQGMPLSQYEYLIDIWVRGSGYDGYAAQMAAAREVFDRLAAATDWRLLLAFNDLQREGARRD
jgi:hypothetical protein